MDLSPLLISTILISLAIPSSAIRAFPLHIHGHRVQFFAEAPEYRNGEHCPKKLHFPHDAASACDPALIHISMTLDLAYLRGTMAAVHSILTHSSCPENVFFHFIASSSQEGFDFILRRSFPSLLFKIYPFVQESEMALLISPSLRKALDKPLNYARNHIPSILPACVSRTIYLDSDVILVDDVKKLWDDTIEMDPRSVIAAPEYCTANFTRYFTERFWRDPIFRLTFQGRKNPEPCYFNTGVMVMDLQKWRQGDYDRKLRSWMKVQRNERIYDLGSLPPLMLVFAGDVHAVDHRWNQHGLGGDNDSGNCRDLHAGNVSLMHWSGKGKPWDRLDAEKPCPVDFVWMPYDLLVKK